jgi:hypothetical protein
MSLIKCSECGKEISDKAKTCPHCGAPVEASEIEKPETTTVNTEKTDVSDVSIDSDALKKKKIIKIAIIVVVIIAALIGAIIGYQQYKEKQYAKNASSYLETCRLIFNDSLDITKMTSNVWYNCIYEESDSKTDKYTQNSNGSFYSDFNDALSKYFASTDYTNRTAKINSNYKKAQKLYKKLQNPPNKMEDTWSAIKTLNKTIITYKNLAIDPTGSYNQFSSASNKAYSNASDAYDKLDGLL